jgi:hypothetical protein
VKFTPHAVPAGARLGEDDQKNSIGVFGNAKASMEGSKRVTSTSVKSSLTLGSLQPPPFEVIFEQKVFASCHT